MRYGLNSRAQYYWLRAVRGVKRVKRAQTGRPASEQETSHCLPRRPRTTGVYRDVLRNRRVAGLLLGDLLANVGTGMIIVAMPVQTLSIHGGVPKAIAIGMVEAAPFVLSTMLALAIGLGRVKVPPELC